MKRMIAVAALAAIPAAALAASIQVVQQQNRAFSQPEISIAVGDTVRLENRDEFIHHAYVHAPSFTFDSDEQEPGTKTDITFTKAGVFEVLCEIHPKMKLVVNVK
jgi:plastocyanin